MKRLLMILLAVAIVCTGLSAPTTAEAATVTADSAYAQSMQRMMDLGIFALTPQDKMDLNRAITREQLATVIILLNGQEDKTSLYKNTALFSDVEASRWSTGYIGAAVKLGYMKAMPDGRFHPTENVTFAQVAVLFGDLLRYDDYNLTGSYPYNYLNLLKNLGILEGINYTVNGTVSRGQIALMMDRLMQTKVFGGNQLFVDTISVYKNLIVLENNVINKNSDARRILTDYGPFYMDAALAVPSAGKKYVARIKDEQIVKLALANMEFSEISVKYATNGKIQTNDGKTLYLPSNLTYYYMGTPSNFDTINASIKTNSSLVIGKKSDGTGYGVLFDPLYSEPRVIAAGLTKNALETLYGGKTIDRDGKYITASQIESDDVVYEVTDIWSRSGYVIIYANSVSGEVTGILPNKISPKSIAIDNIAYTLSNDFPMEKIVGQGSVEVDQTCKLLLSSDGKAIDLILEGESDNKSYALVLDAYDKESTEIEDYGKSYHYVNLLLYNGTKKTYLTEKDELELKGRVVKYEVTALGKEDDDYDTVKLTKIEYTTASATRIEKEDRMIDSSAVTNDVVIFNLINNVYGTDSAASVLKFSDLPNGNIQPSKVKYIHKTGDFQDIDVILFDNILDENVAYGLVTGVTSSWNPVTGSSQVISIMINGVPNTFTSNTEGIYVGSVLRVKTSEKGQIIGVDYIASAAVAGNTVDAADKTRIRMNGVTYNYKADVSILKYEDNSWKEVGTNEIIKGNNYRYISVFLDKPVNYGGKVVLITIR